MRVQIRYDVSMNERLRFLTLVRSPFYLAVRGLLFGVQI